MAMAFILPMWALAGMEGNTVTEDPKVIHLAPIYFLSHDFAAV
jgi:hypothetical protein